jgi:alkaline phosphatase D
MPIKPPHRRAILAGLSAPALSGLIPAANGAQAAGFSTYLFQLGVASGSPTSNAVVLWTRLAPKPFEPLGGMTPEPVAVRWVISDRQDLSNVVGGGVVMTRADRSHSVHVEPKNLAPGKRYWYRFFVGGVASPLGATKTLPAAGAKLAQVRFVTANCQNYGQGYFSAYDGIVEDDPDFVLHLGDYIYDTSFGATVRLLENDKPIATVDDYRLRHALYKMDPSLARAHAALPFFVTIDNHDAVNDGIDATKALRAAAYRAWAEHMPVRDFLEADASHAHIAQTIVVGDLIRFEIPDTRQFRDAQDVCAVGSSQDIGFGLYRIPCDDMRGPQRTMLGLAQEKAVQDGLLRKTRTWNVLASTVPFAPYLIAAGRAERVYASAWGAYPAAYSRMTRALRQGKVENLVVLSGDIHSSWVWDVREKTDDASTTIGTEIVSTSICSECPPPFADPLTASVTHNPHVRYHETTRHGYVLHTVQPGGWTAQIRLVADTLTAKSTMSNGPKVFIKAGRAGMADIS